MDQHLSPWMTQHLDEMEAHRRVSFTVGLLDIVQHNHLGALVLQQLVDNLARARRGEHPWVLRNELVFVEASYQQWWSELRIGQKAAYRVLGRLEKAHFLKRKVVRLERANSGSLKLHIHLREPVLQAAWTTLIANGVYDPSSPE